MLKFFFKAFLLIILVAYSLCQDAEVPKTVKHVHDHRNNRYPTQDPSVAVTYEPTIEVTYEPTIPISLEPSSEPTFEPKLSDEPTFTDIVGVVAPFDHK